MRYRAIPFYLLAIGCTDLGSSRAPVVYGPTDDRIEVFEAPAGPLHDVAASAVATQLASDGLDTSNPADVRITYTQTLSEANNLCAGVRYEDEIEPGACSGTLIDDRHLLTAGHCVQTAEDCDGTTWPWLFGFYFETAGRLRALTSDDVYECARVIVHVNDDTGDYAVIELDRPVVGHTPARVRPGPVVPDGTPLTLIGHPDGIAMKLAGNAHARGFTDPYLLADIDAFEGNSGSGVFDDEGLIAGIEVAGNDDWADQGGCNVIATIDPVPAGDGEQLEPAFVALDAFCATGVSSSACASPPSDGGVPGVDAGSTPSDAGSPDAGPGTARGGCGCSVPSASTGPIAWTTLIAIAALRRRRRSVYSRAP